MRRLPIIILGLAVTLLTTTLPAKTTYKQVQIHSDNLVENKFITLPIVELNDADKATLRQRAQTILSNAQNQIEFADDTHANKYSQDDRTFDLTMNGVSSLAQGKHKTCSTFATTTLLDASVYQLDFISQLCLLALGKTLNQQNHELVSGWNGTILAKVIARIQKYGVIDKSEESALHCGGFDRYPVNDPRTGYGMDVGDYTAHSQKLPLHIEIKDIKQNSSNKLIDNIKEELELGNRIYLSIYVDPSSYNAGFIDNHNTYYYGDTLVLTEDLVVRVLNEEFKTLGAHAMVIYGYDDAAIQQGQKGIFYLRNSWGKSFGYYGDGYVTYDYLELMFRYAKAIQVKSS